MSQQVCNNTCSVPRWLILAAVFLVIGSWLPLAMIAKARVTKSDRPRIHIFQDMDAQPKFKAQAYTELFADHRAGRPPVVGSVARGELFEDDAFYRGYETDGDFKPVMAKNALGVMENKWLAGFPSRIKVDKALLERGRERFNIFCAVCHGVAGYGDGIVHQRASMAGVSSGWVPPFNLHIKDPNSGRLMVGEEFYPNGKLFNVISVGARTMSGYAKQIEVEDRWAIVAYIRALQLSQNFPARKLPAGLNPTDAPTPAPAPVPAPAPAAAPAVAAPLSAAEQAALVEKGKQLYQSKICFTCHQVAKGGPALPCPPFADGIAGMKEKVQVGIGGPVQEITIDEAYFAESIRNPLAKITINPANDQPYPPVMVLPFPVSDDEIKALWAYVNSLGK